MEQLEDNRGALPKILILEDEPKMAKLIHQALSESGFLPDFVLNGQDALKSYSHYDLLIVDVMMPGMGGFDFVKLVRAAGCKIPVVFLTAKDSLESVVDGLGLGGDDYILKPFRLAELIARIRALLRRSRLDHDVLAWGDVIIDRRAKKAHRTQRDLFLSDTEFQLLELFLLYEGQILSKSRLLWEIWGLEPTANDNIVEVYINYLRGKLETHGRSRLIHTVRGQGYVFGNPS